MTPTRPRPRCADSVLRLRADRGSAAIELVLITPVLIALVFGVMQAALLWHARHLATAAAQQGARLARAATATSPTVNEQVSAGIDAAIAAATVSYLQQLSGSLLADARVSVLRSPGFVTVTVTGLAPNVLPFSTIRVQSSSRSPVEGFR